MHNEPMLSGLTILDMSQGIAGPYCGLILGQQGARVIKIEPPSGDWSRQMGRATHGHTAISIAYNAGKESVVLDTRTPEGRQALIALAQRADVIIQNFRPGVAASMGVDYEELSKRNPKLVYVSITGYGMQGPMAKLPALDTTVQAFTGLMHTNRDAAGHPRRIGFFLVDLATGIYAAQTAVAALYRSALNGNGRHLHVSMLQTATALQSYILLDDAMFPEAESAVFNAPTGIYDTVDGKIYVSMLNDAMFGRLSRALGFNDWEQDQTLQHSSERIKRAAELNKRVAQALENNTSAYWSDILTHNDILFGVLNHPRTLLEHPQAKSVGLFQSIAQAEVGALPWPVLPGQESSQLPPVNSPALGEHTERVLKEFGIR